MDFFGKALGGRTLESRRCPAAALAAVPGAARDDISARGHQAALRSHERTFAQHGSPDGVRAPGRVRSATASLQRAPVRGRGDRSCRCPVVAWRLGIMPTKTYGVGRHSGPG